MKQVGIPFQSHSETSKLAAEQIQESAYSLRMRVLRYIEKHPYSTDQEIQTGLKMAGSTERPRRIELENQGLIKKDGVKPTRAGRLAYRWVAVHKR